MHIYNNYEPDRQTRKKKGLSVWLMVGIIFAIIFSLFLVKSIVGSLSGSRITLTDAPFILNMSSDLPSRFKHVDAAQMGISTKTMNLGPDVSEAQLFISENPYQVIYGITILADNLIERGSFDNLINNDQQFKEYILKYLRQSATQRNVEMTEPILSVSHPAIGEVCAFASGIITAEQVRSYFDMLIFRKYQIYVAIYSISSEDSGRASIIPIGNEIIKRMDTLK